MNDLKSNWFYKLCIKQCKKDIIWLGLGVVCLAIAISFIVLRGEVLTVVIFAGLGVAMIYFGADALLFKLPKVKERLEKMDPYEFATMGESAPQCINKTFYFTERFLCAPIDYTIIPYETIKSMTLRPKIFKGRVKGAYIEVEFNDGTPQRGLVSHYKRFMAHADAFAEHVGQYRADIVINRE